MADGSVVFEVGLSTDKFERQMAKLEKELAQKEEELSDKAKVKVSTEGTLKDLDKQFDKASNEAKKYEQELDNVRAKMRELSAAGQRVVLTPEVNGMQTVEYTPQYAQLMEQQDILNAKIQQQKDIIRGIPEQRKREQETLLKIEEEYNTINSKVQEMKAKLGGIKLQKQQADVQKMKEGFNSVGSAIQGAVKKAGKLALGIFAVRSAYMALRRASSDLANYDEQYAANLEYIRYVLTEAIAPILRTVVSLAAKLLGFINAIVKNLFGVSIFGKAGVDSFMKMKQGASGVSSEVKDIKKQLAGFDEMNILQDNGDTTTGGGGGGVAPNIDLDFDADPEIPKWLDQVLILVGGIAGAIVALKLGLNGIAGLGIGIAIAGVVMLVRDLIDFINDPSWEKFGRVLRDIGIAIIGVGIAIGILTGNWIVLLVGLIVMLVGLIIENWETIQEALSQVGDWIYNNVIKPVGDFFVGLWNGIVETFQNIGKWFQDRWNDVARVFANVGTWFSDRFREAWEGIKRVFSGIGEFFAGIWNRIVEIFRNIGVRIGEAVSGAFKTAVNAVFTVLENILNAPIRAINGLIGIINNIPGISLGYLNTFDLPRLKVGGIVNMPNKGTLVGSGNAIAGESGQEGVIPLTDNQAMEQLGEAIGKHITINATVLNKMNGRVISRSLQQVQAENDFAYNT